MTNTADRVLVAHQPAYLPWPGYFTRLFDPRVDHLVALDHVQFIERGWQNRNLVADRRGNPTRLTVPVCRRHGQTINQARIAGTDWSRRHWRSLCQHYSKAAYWPQWRDRLRGIYLTGWDRLAELNLALIRLLLDGLAPNITVLRSSDLQPKGTRTGMLVELCRITGARVLRVGTGAPAYLDAEVLAEAGISVEIATYLPPPLLAARGAVSVLDALLHHGPRTRQLISAGAHTTGWTRLKAVPR